MGFSLSSISYTAVSARDLVKKMRTAFRACRFVSPVSHPDYRGQIRDRFRLYCGETVISSFEDLITAQNSDIGKDLAMMDGQAYIAGYPIIYVAELDAFSGGPVYGIDYNTFYPVCLKGDYLRESGPDKAEKQHNAWNCYVDLTYNFLCVDRRRNFLAATTTVA